MKLGLSPKRKKMVKGDVGVVLGFGAVWFCRLMPKFWRNMLSPSSELK
jgi:hypothetical protein